MKYQKIVNLLNDGFGLKLGWSWVEVNDEARGTYSHNKQIKFKRPTLRSSLCDYSDGYILFKGNIIIMKQLMLK